MKSLLKILLTAEFFITFAAGMLAPIYAIFVENIGGDVLDAAGAYAAFAIVSGLLMYIIGKWEDGHKYHSPLLVLSYVLSTLGYVGYFLITSTIHLFIVQIILGISIAIMYPSYDVLYTKFLRKKNMGAEWGFLEGMDMVVQGISALVGGFIVSLHGFPALFFTMICFGGVGTMCSLWLWHSTT